MKRKWPALLCLLAAAGISSSCETAGTAADRASTSAARPASLEERFVHQTVFQLRDRYLEADTEGFMRLVSDGFYRGRARLEESLSAALAKGAPSEIDAVVGEVEIEDTRISASVTWTAIFPAGGSEDARKTAGETLLIFHRGEGLSLVDFRKDPLFGIVIF